jgi:putative membrane protein
MHWMNGWGGGFGGIFMILFWVLIIVGVIYLVKLVTAGTKTEEKRDDALEILKKRYARGEISKEEFEERKKDLIE